MTSNQILICVIGLFFIATGIIYIIHLRSQEEKTKREVTVSYSLLIFGLIIFSIPFLGMITSNKNDSKYKNGRNASSLLGQKVFNEGDKVDFSNTSISPNHEEASQLYKKGASLWSTDLGGYDSASMAMEYFNKSLILFETAEALTARGQLKVQYSQMNEAMKDFDRAIEIKSDFGNAYFNRAGLFYIFGDTQKACDDWRKAKKYGVLQANEVLTSMCN